MPIKGPKDRPRREGGDRGHVDRVSQASRSKSKPNYIAEVERNSSTAASNYGLSSAFPNPGSRPKTEHN